MGSYTPNLNFYKPDGNEFIDVDVQVNRNFEISDAAVKRLLEYEYSTVQFPDINGSVDRARFYTSYSNSVTAWLQSGMFFYQDPAAFVSTWVSAKNLLQAGWLEHPDYPLRYRVIKRTGESITEIEWTGAIVTQLPDSVTIDVNTNLFIMDAGALPLECRPVTSKYFNVNAGNTSTNYSIARLFFNSNGSAEIKRYGSNPSSPSSENRIEFTGIKYSLEVTG